MKKAKTILLISALLLTFMLTKTLNVMQDTEIWKAVPGYERYYEVSDQGRVRSITLRTPFGGTQVRKTPLILKFNPITGGYLIVRLYKDGKGKDNLVSRLVLSTFNGTAPDGYECDHENRVTSDNRLVNLRWMSPRKNVHHSWVKRKNITSSKYLGVCWDKKQAQWMARITIGKKGKHLGYFDDEYQAHLAYQKELNLIT